MPNERERLIERGDRVRTIKWQIAPTEGEVVAVFQLRVDHGGELRCVVEDDQGILFIFKPSQLEVVTRAALPAPAEARGCPHEYDTLPPDPSDTAWPEGVTACLHCGHIRDGAPAEASVGLERDGELTAEFRAATPLQKWETLALNGLLGTDEPWIDHMRRALKDQEAALERIRAEAFEEAARVARKLAALEAQQDGVPNTIGERIAQRIAALSPTVGTDDGE